MLKLLYHSYVRVGVTTVGVARLGEGRGWMTINMSLAIRDLLIEDVCFMR